MAVVVGDLGLHFTPNSKLPVKIIIYGNLRDGLCLILK